MQVKAAESVEQLKGPLLEMEAALRKSAFAEDWDPSRPSQGGKLAPQVPFDLLRLTVPTQGDPAPGNFPFSRRGPSRWIDPEPPVKGAFLNNNTLPSWQQLSHTVNRRCG